jgi:hypothetical protein
LERGEKERQERVERFVSMIKAQYMHIWKNVIGNPLTCTINMY